MGLKLRKTKRDGDKAPLGRAERIAISLGAKPFDPKDAVIDPDFELEEFLEWRRDQRKADVEAQKACQL